MHAHMELQTSDVMRIRLATRAATPLLLLCLALTACGRDSVTAPSKVVPAPVKMQVAGGENCLYDVFSDDLVCWGGVGDWGDQFGVPYSSGEVYGGDAAYYTDTEGWTDAQGYVSSGALGYPWNGDAPSAFQPHWWGFRDLTWYIYFGNVQVNDNFVFPVDTLFIDGIRPLKQWEDSLFRAETQRMVSTVDPRHFCKTLGDTLQSFLDLSHVLAFDSTVRGTYQGQSADVLGWQGFHNGIPYILVKSIPGSNGVMLLVLRHEAAHWMGITLDDPDAVGQTQNPNGVNYIDPQGPHFKSLIMNANPWTLNANDASYYCAFYATKP